MRNGFRLFADCKPRLSESPIWHKKEKMLYWRGLDGEIFRKGWTEDVHDFEVFRLGIGNIGSIVLTKSEDFLLFGDGGKIWRWFPGSEPVLWKDFGLALFNDCLTDPEGRIYCGVLAERYFEPDRAPNGSFWRLDPDGTMTCIEEKTGTTPNGIRFSPELDRLYFAVTDLDLIYVYDYDRATGELSNRRVFAENCFPDGIATDQEGNVWVTNCRVGEPLLCYNRDGKIIARYDFPIRRVISTAFGGEDGRALFVTTAHEGDPRGEHDGGVFVMEHTVAGAEEFIAPY